jgi:hypothetical protein
MIIDLAVMAKNLSFNGSKSNKIENSFTKISAFFLGCIL